MNKLHLTVLLTAISISCAQAGEGKFVTKLIHDSDEALRISVPSSKFVKILNFTQSGIVEIEPGNFVVGAVYVYQGPTGLPGITVLTASTATSTHVEHEDVYIAGPAIVYIPPLAGAVLCLSYLLGSNH